MKTILSGCSWSNRNYFPRMHPSYDTSYPKWDELLQDYYDWDIVNVYGDALGNVEIIKKAIKEIYTHNTERCIIALSQWYRFSTPGDNRFNPNTHKAVVWDDDVSEEQKASYQKWVDRHNNYFEIMPFDDKTKKALIEETLFQLYILIDLCAYKNIELVVFQMINPLMENQDVYDMLNSDYFNAIHKRKRKHNVNIFGWPFHWQYGGTCFEELLQGDCMISKRDIHPNARGHQEIFRIFKGFYK